jgi:hypothetical protein
VARPDSEMMLGTFDAGCVADVLDLVDHVIGIFVDGIV